MQISDVGDFSRSGQQDVPQQTARDRFTLDPLCALRAGAPTEPDPLMVSKANVRTRVHRRAYMDYVGIKLYHEGGRVSGELRVIGLFTSMALATPHSDVPLVRRKLRGATPDRQLQATFTLVERLNDETVCLGSMTRRCLASPHRISTRP